MMKKVSLHKTDIDIALEYYEDDLELIQSRLEKSKRNYKFLKRVNQNCCELINTNNLLNKLSMEERYNYLLLAKNACLAWFMLKAVAGDEVLVNIDNTDGVILKAEEGDNFSGAEWIHTFSMAMILRDNEAIKYLYNTDISSVKPVNDKDHVHIGYLHFKLLYSMGLDEKPDMNLFNDMETIVLNNMNSYYMPDVAEFPYPNYFFNFNRALILKAIIDNDQEAFTKYLFEGVTYHKMFWGRKEGLNKGEAHLCEDPQGFISWSHTALAAMAYDRGLKIEVDSDYIPMWMIEGNWKNNM
jgi:hypothetical protein